MKDIENEYIKITKLLVGELKAKGLNINKIKIEINGNASRDDYSVNITHNL